MLALRQKSAALAIGGAMEIDRSRILLTFGRLRQENWAFYEEVKRLHTQSPSKRQRGHGMEHNVHVALHALDIMQSDYAGQERLEKLVFLAAIAHSLDRLFERGADNSFANLVHNCLELTDLNESDKSVVLESVLDHEKKNDEGRIDTRVTVILKDADRVANMGAALAIRSGQFRPDIPPYEMAHLRTSNPASTYRDPSSVFEDLRGCFEWIDWMRTERGYALIVQKAANLRKYLETVADEFEFIGMIRVEI